MSKKLIEHRRCSQIKCGYFIQGGCQNCDECRAEPYHINHRCRRCLMCEGKDGDLRWGDKHSNQEDIEQLNDTKQPKKVVMIVGEVE